MKDYQLVQLALNLKHLSVTLEEKEKKKPSDTVFIASEIIIEPITKKLITNLTALLDSHNFGLMTNLEFIQRVTEEVMNYIEKD